MGSTINCLPAYCRIRLHDRLLPYLETYASRAKTLVERRPKMDPNTAVPLYLTILMVILCAIALLGGNAVDKKRGEREKED